MRLSDAVLEELEDVRAWSKTGPGPRTITLLTYVGFVGTPDLLFGFAELFSPSLVVHAGHHFLASGFTTEVYDGWVRGGRTPKEVQQLLNHVHVSTLLQNQEISDDVAVEAARVIAAIWTRTLGPEGLTAEYMGSNLHDAAVTFYDSRYASPG